MKGIIFNLLEDVVTSEYGEDRWDLLLRDTRAEGAWTALGTYPDAEFFALVAAASETLGRDPDDLVRWFGRSAMPRFIIRYPVFFEGHTTTKTFLLTLNDVIHTEVRKLYPGANVPEFDFELRPDGSLAIGYRSARKLCAFAEGLIEGAAASFSEKVVIEQPMCMNRGDERCLLVCAFAPA